MWEHVRRAHPIRHPIWTTFAVIADTRQESLLQFDGQPPLLSASRPTVSTSLRAGGGAIRRAVGVKLNALRGTLRQVLKRQT
jgi:hypothetical protein